MIPDLGQVKTKGVDAGLLLRLSHWLPYRIGQTRTNNEDRRFLSAWAMMINGHRFFWRRLNHQPHHWDNWTAEEISEASFGCMRNVRGQRRGTMTPCMDFWKERWQCRWWQILPRWVKRFLPNLRKALRTNAISEQLFSCKFGSFSIVPLSTQCKGGTLQAYSIVRVKEMFTPNIQLMN